jgi:hypothetical protein
VQEQLTYKANCGSENDGAFGKTPVLNTTVVTIQHTVGLKIDKESGWVNW